VGTTTTGFVGRAPDVRAHRLEPVAINSWREFEREFTSGTQGEGRTATPLALAVAGFFENGGSYCWVVNIGAGDVDSGLKQLATIDEIAIVAAPGATTPAEYEALLEHAETLGDRVAVLDAPGPDPVDHRALITVAGGGGEGEVAGVRARNSFYGSIYYPWIEVRNPFDPREVAWAPPSGHMAGIYARTDTLRGVHKAPANEAVRGALRLGERVTRAEQAILNDAGVNCIRYFASEGIRIWGARTLAPAASEWRYINVRRLFNMVEESIADGTRWVVFEPNDAALWKAIRRDVGAFLTRVWRDGALVGATPQEAFFVKCDAETNPPDSVAAGEVITEIGLAPAKPAEFVIFRIGQQASGTSIEGEQ